MRAGGGGVGRWVFHFWLITNYQEVLQLSIQATDIRGLTHTGNLVPRKKGKSPGNGADIRDTAGSYFPFISL